MITRILLQSVLQSLVQMPVTAIIGPRQSGKTTLALAVAEHLDKDVTYLDLELDSDRSKLKDPELYLRRHEQRLLILDEIQRAPDLFPLMRSLTDQRKRKGERAGHFLILGSASKNLVQSSSESLAGRIRYLELSPFLLSETLSHRPPVAMETLWSRGGFPDSTLAADDHQSWLWRGDFIATYLERDIPQLGPNISATLMRQLWTMIAHQSGQQANYAKLAENIGVDQRTIKHYFTILVDFYMLRMLQPWSGNTLKRLVKSPKVYLRDSGILHRLLHITDMEMLLGHPVVGASWEGFVIENICRSISDAWRTSYYRTHAKAEIDLVLEGPNGSVLAVEIKRSLSPRVSRGFHIAADDIGATGKYIIYPGEERYPMAHNTEAISLTEFLSITSII